MSITDPSPDTPSEPAPDIDKVESPQAMAMFTESADSGIPLDPNAAAFDRVQDGNVVDEEYEREYNRRYVKEHGDHHGNTPAESTEKDPPV